MIRNACEKDLGSIVDLHLKAYPNFFLTKLGPQFLLLMYKIFLEKKDNIFIVNEEVNGLTGLIVGLPNEGSGDLTLALRYIYPLFRSLIRPVVYNPTFILIHLLNNIFFKNNQPEMPTNSIIVRSVCVCPSGQGRGTGSILMTEFSRLSAISGYTKIVLTTDADNNNAALSFYFKNEFKILNSYCQSKKRKMYVLCKNL